ncbi:MAG: NAD-dependent epimerase/dehydratase family protein [Actinomycetota bacterium]|nr:NAD-dependent epimerase/dehydratase family protein [Actinomycetota bacterium]
MKIFMTGATGFIGTATARLLTDQGHSLTCLVRDRSRAADLAGLGCDLVTGSLSTPRPELAEMMKGHDALLHNAALYEVGIPDSRVAALKEANVAGTANVLEASLEAEVPRVLYVSTCAVFGNTRRVAATEEYRRPDLDSPDGLDFTSVYEETKYEAHQIALNLIEKRELPCVIAQPAGVYGPGDHSAIAATLDNFLDGKLPLLPFPDFGTGLAHVDDVAAGLALALDKGETGECYILTADNLTMREIVDTAARLTGKKAPSRAMPTAFLKALRPIGPVVGKLMGQPPNLAELIKSADGVTFWADPSKARRELGFNPRDFETGLRQTLEANGRL